MTANKKINAGIRAGTIQGSAENHLNRRKRDVDVRIEPRKATDRGGFYCMPLRANVPVGAAGWELKRCPECGAECWKNPLAKIAEAQGAKGICTMCALKKGIGGSGHE